MTLLVREVGRFLAETGLWVLVVVAIASVVSTVGLFATERHVDLPGLGVAAATGAVLAAAAHRVPSIVLWDPRVGGRPLPIAWVVIGAAIATTVLIVRRRPSRR